MSSYPHGNYQNYYSRRRKTNLLPTNRDERIALLVEREAGFFRGKRVLDIGCNVGQVAVEVAQRHGASHVIGVDIDTKLISQCPRTVREAYSIQAPAGPSDDTSVGPVGASSAAREEASTAKSARNGKKRRKCNDGSSVAFPSSRDEDLVGPDEHLHYFPACFPSLLGLLPLPHHSSMHNVSSASGVAGETVSGTGKRVEEISEPYGLAHGSSLPGGTTAEDTPALPFPRNVSFAVRDWTIDDQVDEVGAYDIILALSITKWIHLNTLDAGLIAFFHKIYACLRPGGEMVLEKQGWKGYKEAKRGDEQLKHNYTLLEIRPETDFERILLEDVGFSRRDVIREVEPGEKEGFDRALEVYYKD